MDNKTNVLMKRYEIGRLLGQGTFAKVYYGRSLKTNQSVAVKVIDKEKIFKVGIYDQIKREISVMRLVKHPNVIRLYEVMATKMRIYFVLEFAKGGELFNKVARGRFKEELALKYFQQLINAVEFCHSRGVYHRDIKPENILLDENENLKISDFGLSALAESKRQDGLLHTTCGTPAYVAPEVINRKGYDGAKADIWSCGVVLFVILAGYLPFHDANLMAMYRKIEKADYKCPNWFPPEVRRMLCRILDPNPHTRMSITKIKENSWFKRGLTSKRSKTQTDSKNVCPPDTVVSGSCETSLAAEGELKELKPANLNAFDIIALSDGFDLTGLFEDKSQKMEARFTSRQPANVIISKLEEIAKLLQLRVQKKEAGLVKFEAQKEGRRGVLSIDAEIFEVTPSFYMVDVKKSSGDTLEYQRVLKEDIKPALKDIVWVWQGDEQEQPRPEQHIQAEDEQQQQQQQEEHRGQNL